MRPFCIQNFNSLATRPRLSNHLTPTKIVTKKLTY